MIAIGGGASSELFVRMKADVLGVEAIRTEARDTALVGSAAIAGYGDGVLDDYRAAIRKTIRNKPPVKCDPECHEKYKGVVKKYLAAIEAANGLY
jgi:xylulokinase